MRLLICLALFNFGCQIAPSVPDLSEVEARRQEQREQYEDILRRNPSWRNTVSDDVLIVECNSSGSRTICVGR